MSNLPAPFDPNLLPAIHHGYSMPYSQNIFLIELPGNFSEPLQLRLGDGLALELQHAGGTVQLDPARTEILARLLEAGKKLQAEAAPGGVRIHLQEL